jgi:RNA polymerase sigma factor (TIGR02999 family)
MAGAEAETIHRLMADFRRGDKQAANSLVELFYPQLRRLAATRMKSEKLDHTWQPTVLVNEFYLELLKIKALRAPEEGEDEKSAFFGLAAHMMRRLLIHHARPLSSKIDKVELEEDSAADRGLEEIAEIEKVLEGLERVRPRLRAIVQMKVFEGLTLEEIAARLDCATATVTRDWSFARHWLQKALSPPED